MQKNELSSFSVDRRRWLHLAGGALATAALGGCATMPASSAERRGLSHLPFHRPRVAADQVVRTVVGLRPFRPSGFVVRGERMGDKIVIHNYGHGGAGITLSWGSSVLAVRMAPDIADRRAAVVGCGALGLATAAALQARGWSVTIHAKDLPPHTTSDIAGGLWAPTSAFSSEYATPAFDAQLREALRISHHTFGSLVGAGYGVSWRENYYLSARPQTAADLFYLREFPELFPSIAELKPGEHPFASPHVIRHISLLIEPPIYLRRMLRDVREAGARVVVREFRDRAEVLALPEPVVFNCTGLGAKALFGDEELTPVRGQLAFLPPDERIDYLTHGGGQGLLYMFPRADGILLGGSFERGASHLVPDPEITARVLREHARIFGEMRA